VDRVEHRVDQRAKTKYVQRVIDLVYSRGCIKRETIILALTKELQEPPEKIRDGVKGALKRLVRAGVVERRGRGYYCRSS